MAQDNTPLYLQFYHSMLRLKNATNRMPPPHPELSHFDFLCLHLIRKYGEDYPEMPGMKVSLLSEAVRLSRPATTQHINGLEARGLLTRCGCETDRRVTYLCLTPQAHALLQECREGFLRQLQAMCDRLGREDTEKAIELNDKMSQIYVALSKQTAKGEAPNPLRKDRNP